MPRPKKSVPSYSLHKPTGQAYVRLPDGAGGRKTVYLGAYDSPESRAEYARLVAELAAAPVPAAPTDRGGPGLSVNELLLAFWRHAERHYRRADGTPTNELPQYRQTFRLVKELYGHTPAAGFGPRALKVLRQRMIDAGWNRKLVNQRVGRVRRVFKWAASEELLPVAVNQALAAVPGLAAGRTAAKEMPPVGPVAEEHVRATLPFLRPGVAAMVEVQLLTGMRPGEVCQLRPCDLDTSAPVWLFRPKQHKTRHREKPRVVAIGPKAQALLSQFAPSDPADYYFSPRRVVEQFHAARSAARGTPRYGSHMARNARKRVAAPRRPPAEQYNVTSYGHAVTRAIRRANRELERKAAAEGVLAPPLPHWHPNQLRHTHGTAVRHRYGLEAAQVALGHAHATVTEVYAQTDLALALRVAAAMG
jgi:integrase